VALAIFRALQYVRTAWAVWSLATIHAEMLGSSIA
jgi:hypothetical protein